MIALFIDWRKASKVFCLFITTLTASLTTTLAALPASAEQAQNCQFSQPSIDSKDIVSKALQCHPGVAASHALWRSAQAQAKFADAFDDPTLSYAIAPNTIDTDLDVGQRIEISQALPWPGKRALRRAQYLALSDAQEAKWQDGHVMIAQQARQAYAKWQYIHQALRILQQNKSLWQEFYGIAQAKYAAGKGSKQVILQAESEALRLDHRLIVLTADKRSVQAQINRLLNRAPEAIIPAPVAFQMPSLPGQLQSQTQEQKQSQLFKQPRLRQLSAKVQAKDAERQQAEKDYYPNFRVMAAYNSLWMNDDQRLMVGVGVNLPFGGAKRHAQVDSLNAQQQSLQWKIQDTQAQINRDISQAQIRWQESQHVLDLYQQQLLPLAKDNLHAGRDEYQSGQGDFLSLLTAERQWRDTQLQTLQAQREILIRHAQLLAAMGVAKLGPSHSQSPSPSPSLSLSPSPSLSKTHLLNERGQ